MTVKQLIDTLSACDENAEVAVYIDTKALHAPICLLPVEDKNVYHDYVNAEWQVTIDFTRKPASPGEN